MGLIGTLGEVAYDIIANDRTDAGTKSASDRWRVTSADIVNAVNTISDPLQRAAKDNAVFESSIEKISIRTGIQTEALLSSAKAVWQVDDSVQEITNSYDLLTRAGLRNVDTIQSSFEAFDMLADASGQATDSMIDGVIPAFQQFGIPLADATKYIDELAVTFNETTLTAEDFQALIAKSGPTMASFGMSLREVEVLLMAMAEHGIQGRKATAELNAAMTEAEKNGTGYAGVIDYLNQKYGVSREELDRLNTKLDQSSGYAQKLADAEMRQYTVQDEMNHKAAQGQMAFGGLSGSLGQVAAAGASALPFLVQIGTVLALFPGLASTVSGALTIVGTAIAGSFAAAIAAGIVVGLASVWVLVQTGVMDWIGGIGKMFSDWAPQWAEDVILVIASPFASVGAAILDIVKGDWDSIGEDMLKPFEWAGEAIGRSVDGIRNSLYSLTDAAYQMGADFGGAVGSVVAGAVAIFSGIGAAFQGMAGQFGGIFQNIVDNVYKIMAGTYEGFVNIGKNIIFSMVNGIMAAGSSILEAIQGIFGQLAGFFGFGGGTASTVATRAAGGPVSAGSSYLVGERGPELFTPGSSGEISPTGSFGGSQNITINIMGAEKDPVQIANEVAKVLQQTRKQRGMTI